MKTVLCTFLLLSSPLAQAAATQRDIPQIPPINLPIQRSVAVAESLSKPPHTIYETQKDVLEIELCLGIAATTTDGTSSKFRYKNETVFVNGGAFPMAIRYIPNGEYAALALYGRGDQFLRKNVELCLDGSKPVYSK